ncbi:ATP-binding protein [Microbacterium sp. 1.5R]|uniref:sensor histidine kinase n=1 Tax=Microbacterium sp. 1.5R TaxID=1916917 RepID=UPI001642A5D5|nr:ATP-binding protein [Microbacterium sp. 1.5R]
MRRGVGAGAARLGMLVLPSVIVLAAVGVTAGVAIAAQERSIRAATADRVHEVAVSLAVLPEVQRTLESAVDSGDDDHPADAVDLAAATEELQPLADIVGQAAGVYYVVITDDEGVRITHPLASERGVRVSTTNESVLAGEEFLGTETGPSGRSLRAKVPVYGDGDRIVGMVAVGVLESSLSARRDEALGDILPWIIGALVVGTLASSAVGAAIERRFRRLDEQAAEHEHLRRISTALQEQSHEFSTRLHVIHGLVSHGDADDALAYIDGIVPVLTTERPGASGGPVVSVAIDAVRRELTAQGAQLEVEVDDDVEIDEGVLLVVANLCRNAGEAGAGTVRCTLRQRGQTLVGSVDDDGPGIDPAGVERVFARGYSSKTDRTVGGRGIGLDLVRRTVMARGGVIEVGRSALGGARFDFEMDAVR